MFKMSVVGVTIAGRANMARMAEWENIAFLVAIQPGRNEQPQLMEHEWRGRKQSSDETISR